MLASDVVEDTLASGWLTYRRFGGRLVARNHLIGEPQRAAAVSDFRDAEVVAAYPTDRYLGARATATTVGRGDDETKCVFGPVVDTERVVEAFDLPVEFMTLSPLDRCFAWAAVASVVLTAVGVVTVVATPLGPSTSWLLALFLFPTFAIIPRGFWRLTCS